LDVGYSGVVEMNGLGGRRGVAGAVGVGVGAAGRSGDDGVSSRR